MNQSIRKYISFGLFAFLLASTLFIAPVNATEVTGFTKKIVDPSTGDLVSELTVDVGDTVSYNITLIYYSGETNLYNISIHDVIPECLSLNESSIEIKTDYPEQPDYIVALTGQHLYINFSYGFHLDILHPTLTISYDAAVEYSDEAVNVATVTAYNGSPLTLYENQASAELNINPFSYEMLGRNEGEYSSELTALYNDSLSFKIEVEYFGNNNLTDLNIFIIKPFFLILDSIETIVEYQIEYPEDPNSFSLLFPGLKLNATTPSFSLILHMNVTSFIDDLPIEGEVQADLNAIHEMDEDNLHLYDNEKVIVTIVENQAPDLPAAPTCPITDSPGYGFVGYTYEITMVTSDPNNDQISYSVDWDDGTISEWTDFFDSGVEVTLQHSWSTGGVKDVRVQAKDDRGAISEFGEELEIILFVEGEEPDLINNPPLTPGEPGGDSTGGVEEILMFTAVTTDPEGSQIKYIWDFDDSIFYIMTDYYESGEECIQHYSWEEAGVYEVRVKARDVHGNESDWSPVKQVTISGGDGNDSDEPDDVLNVSIDSIQGGLGISAIVKNTGDVNYENLSYELKVKGKRFFCKVDVMDTGSVNLTSDDDLNIKVGRKQDLKGFGAIDISVKVTVDGYEPKVKNASGFIIGPFVFIRS